jgi:hypothetical protein
VKGMAWAFPKKKMRVNLCAVDFQIRTETFKITYGIKLGIEGCRARKAFGTEVYKRDIEKYIRKIGHRLRRGTEN